MGWARNGMGTKWDGHEMGRARNGTVGHEMGWAQNGSARNGPARNGGHEMGVIPLRPLETTNH